MELASLLLEDFFNKGPLSLFYHANNITLKKLTLNCHNNLERIASFPIHHISAKNKIEPTSLNASKLASNDWMS